ncbi:MAG: SusC/RagA family TonB-linked outer membrane protein [Bacteroidales bacterium]|nr:SusC/RagA family TonB-linked outer membrane protein [Bacteroidales bacterium]
MKRILTILSINLFLSLPLFAQEKVFIKGKVLFGSDGKPIIGATIVEEDNNGRIINGTISDFDGNFIFNANSDQSVLKISFIGYKTQSVEIKGKTNIEVTLYEDQYLVDEVTVVAVRTGNVSNFDLLPKAASTASSSRVDMEMAEGVAVTSLESALQGTVANLDIVGGGNPGSSSSIRIRGLSTLSGAEPLIVIDDVPYDQQIDDNFDFGSSDAEDISNLLSIPMEDVASIDVLKDAAATAVYGAKGANGVIRITTKKGTQGKTRFSYSFKGNINVQPPPIPLLNGDEYVTLQREQLFATTGYYNLPIELAFDPDFSDYYNYSQNTDWLGAITQKGMGENHHFSISGGGDKTNYYSSVSYLKDQGTLTGTGLTRLSTRVKLDYRVSKKFRFTSNFSYSSVHKEGVYSLGDNDGEGKDSNVRKIAKQIAPNMSIYEYDEYGNLTGEYFSPETNYQGTGVNYYNPVAFIEHSGSDTYQDILTTNLTAKLHFLRYLHYTGTVSYGYTGRRIDSYISSKAIGAFWNDQDNNRADNTHSDAISLQFRNQLNFIPILPKDHFFAALASLNISSKTNEALLISGSLAPSDEFTDPSAEILYRNMRNTASEIRRLNSLVKTSYVFKDRYAFDVGITVDGLSKLSRKNRYGIFPVASTSWQVQKEPWLRNVVWLDQLKLRGSYGITGNIKDGDAYVRFATYSSPNIPIYLDNSVVKPGSVQLDNMDYEKTAQLNFGVNLSLFDGVLDAVFDLYNKTTTDILWKNLTIPSTSGYGSLKFMNGGELENKGVDFVLSSRVYKDKNWFVRLIFNISHNENTFNAIPENFNLEKSLQSTTQNGQYGRRINIGEPMGAFYGYIYKSVWASDADVVAYDIDGNIIRDVYGNAKPLIFDFGGQNYQFKGGDAIYEDLNGDGQINGLDMTYLGDANPDFFGSFGLSVKYKAFNLRTQFYYRYGFEIVNKAAMTLEKMNDKDNQSTAVLYRWRKQGDSFEGIIPRAYSGSVPNWLGSDRFVEDGSYMRFKNLTLTYELPKSICNHLFVNKLNLSFNMRNIATWTGYSGQDPEIPIKINSSDPFKSLVGEDNDITPQQKEYTLSLTMNF